MPRSVIFFGSDAGDGGLWATDGTAATTHSVTGFGGQDPINPQDFITFDVNGDSNGTIFGPLGARLEVLFAAGDASGQEGLWVTDGTGAGTHEITGISGADTFGGLNPTDFHLLTNNVFFPFDNRGVLFAGEDSHSHTNLWVTDGTAAGTHELIVQGADPNSGLVGSNPGFTTFGEKVYFEGFDASGEAGLWVTDGSAAGTQLVTDGAARSLGFVPQFITVFKSEMLFEATNTSNIIGLWASDGTAGGTQELTGIASVFSEGIFFGESALDLNPGFASATGGLVFLGHDANNQFGLWVTDGTAGGTHELTGISGASANGLAPRDLTQFHGGEVLFRGTDVSGNLGLWITDGTIAGTHELTGITGAANDLDPQGLTVLGNEALFTGDDATNSVVLWETDGTAVGTHEIGSTFGVGTMGAAAVGVTPPDDFTGNYVSDALFRNQATGEVDTWLINGDRMVGGTVVSSLSSAWRLAGTGDITGNGTSDVLWQNTATGEVDSWLITNGHLSGGSAIGHASSVWQPLGTGQFNGDGISDLLWRNTNTGEVDTWLMTNGNVTGGTALGMVSSAWQFAGMDDFNGDGISDVLWHNTTTGEVDTWLVNNGTLSGGSAIGHASSVWQALGTGDFNGDGTADILWRNMATGEVDTWIMNNGKMTGGTVLGSVSSAWQLAGIGHYGGDATSGILWHNVNTGEVDTWVIGNGQLTPGSRAIGTASSVWQPQVIHTG
jgi:ELWxxDGT repeat protein